MLNVNFQEQLGHLKVVLKFRLGDKTRCENIVLKHNQIRISYIFKKKCRYMLFCKENFEARGPMFL